MIIDIVTYTDADFVQKYEYRTIGNAPIDLTSFALRMIVRINPQDAATYIECSTLNGRITITDALEGAFTLFIPYSILSELSPGIYVQSLILTDLRTYSSRKEVWRGVLTHIASPSRWNIGTFE